MPVKPLPPSPPRPLAAALLALLVLAGPAPGQPPEAPPEAAPPAAPTSAEVLEAAAPSDWRALDPERTLYVELPGGRVVIELAPEFAPRHVENVVKLAREGYFDGLAVLRSQENYVVQWGDPKAGEEGARAMRTGKAGLAAEFDRPIARDGGGDLPFTALPDGDVYAPEVGFTLGFPVARDRAAGRTWLAHCYAMVGAGRGDTADSGSGAELYVVIGHSPRHLDRNVTLLGRVVRGMEVLSTLPRGTGALGFYEDPAEHVPVRSVKVAADLPAAERTPLELLRTDTATFEAWIASRRHRRESWFLDPVGRIELCNVPLPVRAPPPTEPADG
ncbi:MAG TPA: peptidylprolyl isomerase [Thermoanaerobaculia bacterium]